jgi:hypothetical protein
MTRIIATIVVCLGLAASPALAYTPPVDTAGPLRVRIEGPELVTQADTPQAVRVVLENKGPAALQGTLRLSVIDRWRAEPAGAVAFTVPARETVSKTFQITAGRGTYSAHYPVHAWADFTLDGRPRQAHPILILQTKLPAPPPAASPLEWKTQGMPNPGRLALGSMPTRRTVVEVFNEPPKVMPVGWRGGDERTGASAYSRSVMLGGQSREALVMHPPWMNGHVGAVLTEFPLALPAARPLVLEFANAIQPLGQSDGVTFRVRVVAFDAPPGKAGEVVYERHTTERTWLSARADLSRWAGQTVRIQLESHPGPKHNTGWDESYWAEPTLVAGTPPAPLPFPPAGTQGSQRLGTIACGGTQYEVRLWPGQRGLLDAAVGFTGDGRRLLFQGFQVRVLQSSLDDPGSPYVLLEARSEASPGGLTVRHRFQGPQGSFDLVGRLTVERQMLRAAFALENVPPPKPWLAVRLEDVAAGSWSAKLSRVYAGHGNVIREPKAFRAGFDGHRLATSFVGFDFEGGASLVQAVDVPPERLEVQPDEQHYSLHAPHTLTMQFVPGPSVWEAVKCWRANNGLRAAGGVRQAAGRFVFDLWGGRYADQAAQLRQAFQYGLTDAMVIWHNWQRWGYDYRLPDIYPPNPELGTLEEMQALVKTCKQAGVLFGVHDNYIDFYPDADGFSYERQIAFHSPGHPVQAWLNEYRQARSYRFRADTIEPLLKRNVEWIRSGLAPTAYFIDVWSSIDPYDYWTADGRFFTRVYTRDTWGRLFAWIRDRLGADAPQISESGHDQLIGWLDGGQTNHSRVGKPGSSESSWFVWDVPCAEAERIPWHDAAHHDRFVLHGSGYPGRYEAGLDPRLHGIYSDDYMATEVLTGHPSMVAHAFSRDVVRKYWLLAPLGRALALRTIEGVEFVDGNLHRQHVDWSGGGEVWVNRGDRDWIVPGAVLPEFGFSARVPTPQGMVETSISRRQGVIVEQSRWPGGLYVNGRLPVDGPRPIRLALERLQLGPNRTLEMKLTWHAESPIPAGWHPFIHFVDQAGAIAFQPSQSPSQFAAPRQGTIAVVARAHLPATAKAGQSFDVRYGIYNPATGERLPLVGVDDGESRIRLGSVALEGAAEKLAAKWTSHRAEPDLLLRRLNPQGRPIDFGPVVTAGACRVTRSPAGVLVTPLVQANGPRFSARIRWSALPWRLPEPVSMRGVRADGQRQGPEPVRRDGEFVLVESSGADAWAIELGK